VESKYRIKEDVLRDGSRRYPLEVADYHYIPPFSEIPGMVFSTLEEARKSLTLLQDKEVVKTSYYS
jgi:hypothetical protein